METRLLKRIMADAVWRSGGLGLGPDRDPDPDPGSMGGIGGGAGAATVEKERRRGFISRIGCPRGRRDGMGWDVQSKMGL